MKQFFSYLLTLFTIILICACSNGQVKNNDHSLLSADDFNKQIKRMPAAIIIDVRTPEEYERGHIDHAVNINWNSPDFGKQISSIDTSATIFVYCLSGGRSADASFFMHSKGFKNIYELDGGISAWRKSELPVTSESATKDPGMTQSQFESLLLTDTLVLVDFYTRWCAP